MTATINTNIASLNAQRNLTSSQSALATSLQRLSSGLRINSAKDDAAGLAISERFSTQIRGLNQAIRNANDGVSLAQTGEGALAEMSNNLQRIRELAVQSANATNSASDRAAIDLEVQQRLAEIDRTATQTSFNGQKILNGAFKNASFQVGANAGETISVDLSSDMRLGAMGSIAKTESTALGGTVVDAHIDVTSTNLAYGTAYSPATPGSISFVTTTADFRGQQSKIDGKSAALTVANVTNFGTAFVGQVDGSNVATITTNGTNVQSVATAGLAANFSARGSNTQTVAGWDQALSGGSMDFLVDGKAVSVNSDYTAGTQVKWDLLVSDIQGDLNTATAGITVTGDWASETLVFTRNASAGIDQGAITVNAGGAGLANTAGITVSSAGTAGTALNLTVGGATVIMSGDYQVSGLSGFLSDLNGQISGNDITATNTAANEITFTRDNAGDTKAIALTADAKAMAKGFGNDAAELAGVGTVNTTAYNFTGNEGSFSIARAGGDPAVVVALTGNYVADGGKTAGEVMAADIQATLQGTDLNYTATFDNVAGKLTIKLAGSTDGVVITQSDSNATNSGIVATDISDADTMAATGSIAGKAEVPTTNVTFSVDDVAIALTENHGDKAALIDELNRKMAATGSLDNYEAVIGVTGDESGKVVIHNKTVGADAVVITDADAKARAAGFINSTGTDGQDEVLTDNSGTFTIAGDPIVLNQDYGSADGLAGYIKGELGANYDVTNVGGTITVARNNSTGPTSNTINIAAASANAMTGLGVGADITDARNVGTAGDPAVETTNAKFSVDGHEVVLDNASYADQSAVAADIESQLNAFNDGTYDVTGPASATGTITIKLADSAAAVEITDADANAISGGFAKKVGVAQSAEGVIDLSGKSFTIASGMDTAIELGNKSYTSAQKLADAINSTVNTIFASVSDGKITLSSSNELTLGGTYNSELGFASATVATTDGKIEGANTKSVASSNDLIQRVDAALGKVSTFRSTFGSIQNRFESTIANLSGTAENLTAARSRIVDTDFAVETANLTRNQILQQAGTAMLAQANALPQSVLSLLK